MDISLESLGLSTEDMRERLVDAMIDRFLTSKVSDEDGEPVVVASQFQAAIRTSITKRVDESVERLLAPALDRNIDTFLRGFVIQPTNGYGEPKREPRTITEYMADQVHAYLFEGVDALGKTKKERGSDSYNFASKANRVTFLIDQKLQELIATKMSEALKEANSLITNGLKAAVAFELDKLNAKLKA